MPNPADLPDAALPAAFIPSPWPENAPPVFVGLCKMQGMPRLEADHALCLDHPQAPCVHRLHRERRLLVENLHVVPRHKIALAGNPLTSTGQGHRIPNILFRTIREDAEAGSAPMGLVSEFRDTDPDDACFTWNPMGRGGDGETVVLEPDLILPPGIPRQIMWRESTC